MATAFKQVADNAVSTTATSLASTGVTSITLATGDGAKFPAPGNGFWITIWSGTSGSDPASDANMEKVLCTARSGDVLTIAATTKTHSGTVNVGLLSIKQLMDDITTAINALENGAGNTAMSWSEVPAGSVNGSNTAFTTASNMMTGSLRVTRNGIRLKGGGVDFTQGVNNAFTMTTAPSTGDILLVDYVVYASTFMVGTNSTISSETPSGSVNGSNTTFTTARAYIAGSLEVYLDGVHMTRVTDYTETTPGSGIFTMASAPASGQEIVANYQFNLNPSSNADAVDGIHASTTPTAGQLLALNSRAQSGEWWEEIGRTTLATAGNTISVASLPTKKYLCVIITVLATGGTIDASIRFNNDSASSYSYRASTNGNVDSSSVSQTNIQLTGAASYAVLSFKGDIANIAVAEKNIVGFRAGNFSSSGAGTAPDRAEITGKWANTSAQISRVDILNITGTGNFAIGSEVVILGHD